MKKALQHFELETWKEPDFILRVLEVAAFFCAVLIVNYYAARYVLTVPGPRIPDLMLDSIPYYDTSYIHFYLAHMLEYFTLVSLFFFPRKLLFAIKALGLLILTRSFFIILTHLGNPSLDFHPANFFTMGSDLFFSGHVAIPVLMAQIFWDNKFVRTFSLLLSVVMAGEVLMGRFHYSIDVFAAPFFSYGVFNFCKAVFKKDYQFIVSKRV